MTPISEIVSALFDLLSDPWLWAAGYAVAIALGWRQHWLARRRQKLTPRQVR